MPANEVVLYADEVDIHLNPKIDPDWMLCGTQKSVLTPGKNEKRYLAGALNAHTGRLTWVEADRKNSDLFIRQLWQLASHDYPKARCIHIILDNFKIHSSQRTALALGALGSRVKLHFLPPYCPDHNRIERTWRDLHDNVTRNHTCRSMKQLMSEFNMLKAAFAAGQPAILLRHNTHSRPTSGSLQNRRYPSPSGSGGWRDSSGTVTGDPPCKISGVVSRPSTGVR